MSTRVDADQNSERLVIAAGADEGFAFPLAVTLYGALNHLSPGTAADVYVVDGGLTLETKSKISGITAAAHKAVNLHFVTPKLDLLCGVPLATIGPMTYLRLLLPDALPSSVSHVLYLDSDLLVRGDLAQLWKCRPLTRSIAAAVDFSAPKVSATRALPNWRELGLSAEAPYVNAGVLLMNLRRWRTDDFAVRILEYSRKHADINRYADQDGINALLCDDCDILAPHWNVPAYLDSDALARNLLDDPLTREFVDNRRGYLSDARIIHFIGNRKPWYRGLGLASQREWLYQSRASGWFSGRAAFARWSLPIWLDYFARRLVRQIKLRVPQASRSSAPSTRAISASTNR